MKGCLRGVKGCLRGVKGILGRIWRLDFSQWNHHEVALVHERMGDFQVGLVDVEVVIEQDVDVDGAVLVVASLSPDPSPSREGRI